MQMESAKPKLNCLNGIGIKTLEQISSEKYRIVTCIAFIEFLSSSPLPLPSTVEILARFSFGVITLKFMKSPLHLSHFIRKSTITLAPAQS